MIVDLHSDIGLRGEPEELAELFRSIATALEAGWMRGTTPFGDWWLIEVEEDD